MQQTPQKYVQHEQKQSIVNVCLNENGTFFQQPTNVTKLIKLCSSVSDHFQFILYFFLVSSYLFSQKHKWGKL